MTYYNSSCPVETTLQLISSRWKVLILRDLLEGTRRFGELRKSIGPVTQKVLTANLRSMEKDGLLTRKVHAEVPPRVEYTLRNWAQSAPRPGLHGGMGIEIPKRKPLILPPFPELNRTSGKTWKYSGFPFFPQERSAGISVVLRIISRAFRTSSSWESPRLFLR